EIVWVLLAGEVRTNDGPRVTQHVVEPIEEHRVHMREVTGMFVRRPPTRSRPAFQNWRRHFLHQRNHDVGGSAQGVDYCGNAIHVGPRSVSSYETVPTSRA